MDLQLREEQKQILNQQIYQSMGILALNATELEAFLQNAAEENPLLEVEPAWGIAAAPIRYTGLGSGHAMDMDNNPDAAEEETLEGYLCGQLALMRVDDKTARAARYLAGNLDERGYLILDEGDIQPPWEKGLFNRALSVLQELEPAGVGARSIGECLTLQLARRGETNGLLYTLAGGYMERLGRGQMNSIAKELGIPVARVVQARNELARLSPKPGNGFGRDGYTDYMVPDVELRFDSVTGEPCLSISDLYMPRISLNSCYMAMLAGNELCAEEREYMNERMRAAKWMLECVERRNNTLLTCARAVACAQTEFFRDETTPLRLLSVQSVAREMGVHPSTVYRAVQGKRIACAHGVYPLSAFFTGGIVTADEHPEAASCRSSVKSRIGTLIADEDKRRPLSDQVIADALEREGTPISRRTVAKYRDELGIPAAAMRKCMG